MDVKDITLKELIINRPDLVEAILAEKQNGTTIALVEKDKTGKITKWTEERRDIDGALISKRIDDYTYALDGNVDEISLKWYDGIGKLNFEKVVNHSMKMEKK